MSIFIENIITKPLISLGFYNIYTLCFITYT
nr:MAG TPA: hypothetical protein [Caudoviricetes sp.]